MFSSLRNTHTGIPNVGLLKYSQSLIKRSKKENFSYFSNGPVPQIEANKECDRDGL